MDTTETAESPAADKKYLTVRQAAFIGVGAMVGAGIFALLGAAGEVAGAAVWLTYLANAIVTAMVAVSFGSYATSTFAGENQTWIKVFAALIIIVMTGVNIVGSQLVANAQTVIVYVVLGILSVFAIVTLVNMTPSLLAPSKYPPFQDIISSVALTFFAFLGFGIITFTAKDLAKPARQLPRAMYLALGIATVIYIAIALGVFGTLTVDKVISSGGTAIAVAAEPTLGRAGYWLMTVTALFATAGATNAGLYPAAGLSERLAETGQFPPLMARKLGGRASAGLLIAAAVTLVLALGFNLDAIASIGSAVALVIFTMITAAHLRIRAETGAKLPILALAIVAAGAVFVTFVFTTLIHEPASIVTLLVIVVLSIGLDYGWKRSRPSSPVPVQVGP
jgi:amino acid transporter